MLDRLCGHLAVQLLHRDKIERLQGMSTRGNEIQAGMDSGVMTTEQGAFYLKLFFKVLFKLGIDVFKNGFKAVKQERNKERSCYFFQ